MHLCAKWPPAARAPRLGVLLRSLNKPVLAIPELPPGPASAAVAVCSVELEMTSVVLAVKCEKTRQIVFYRGSSDRVEPHDPGVALEAALSAAESLGFLFDEDEVEPEGSRGPRAAAQLWRAFLMGDEKASGVDYRACMPPGGNPVSGTHRPILSKFRW